MSRAILISILAISGCCSPRVASSSASHASPSDSAVHDELPDLIVWASEARGLLYDTSIDTETQPGRRLVRFSVATANIGDGPLEVEGILGPGGRTSATQIVYRSDGSTTRRAAGTFVFDEHADHTHWHLADYAQYNLRAISAGDGVGAIVARSTKVSFCLMDSVRYDARSGANAIYNCGRQGISVGWADVYGRQLTGQWIDVTGVPAGAYWLEVIVDPLNRLAEKDESNNVARVRITLN